MYIKKLTGLSLIALGAMSPLMAEPAAAISEKGSETNTALSEHGPDILMQKIQDQRNAVRVSEDQFKQLVGRLIKQGTLVSIGELVEHKTDEYTNAWAEVQALHAAYEAAQSGFASGKDEPAGIQALRVKLTEKQTEYDALEDEGGAAPLGARPNAEKLKRQITFLEDENEDLYGALEDYSKMDRATKGKVKGLKSKAKRAKGVEADRYVALIQTQEDLLSQNDEKIQKNRQEIKENEAKLQTLKADSDVGSSTLDRAKSLREKRFAKQLLQKEIKRIKADLKIALKAHSTGRVNKKAVKAALSEVVVAYTQFVQKFVGAGQGSQNCLEQCTKMLLTKTEDTLTKPAGTCGAGSLPPGAELSSDFDQDSSAGLSDRDDVDSDDTALVVLNLENSAHDSSSGLSDRDDVGSDDTALVVSKSEKSAHDYAPTSEIVKSEKIKAFSAKISDALRKSKLPENHTLEMKAKLEDLDSRFQGVRNLADDISDNGRSGPYIAERRKLLARGMQLRNLLAEFKVLDTPMDDAKPLAIEAPKVAALTKEQSTLVGRIYAVVDASKNMKPSHKNRLLSAINIEENCSKIKKLSNDSRIKKQEQVKIKKFLIKYDDRC